MRRFLRILLYTVAAVLTGYLIWAGLEIIAIYVHDEPTPECTDSETCGTLGALLFSFWPGVVVCLLLGAVAVFGVDRLVRRLRPIRRKVKTTREVEP